MDLWQHPSMPCASRAVNKKVTPFAVPALSKPGSEPALRKRTARRSLRKWKSYVNWQVAQGAANIRKAWYKLRGVVALAVLGLRNRQLKKQNRPMKKLSIGHIPVGREDEVPVLHEDKPVMLTPLICLIPGDDPVVRVEDAPGNARRIFTGVDICATVSDVWEVLTDYHQLQVVVPNLVKNKVLQHLQDGGAKLWQTGRASWSLLGKTFYFSASTTLEVHLHPEGLPEECTAGVQMDAATSAEVREYSSHLPMLRDIFPRPFSIPCEGVPVRDISMQNVIGEKGDFVHYRGVWRLQPLVACAPPGTAMMRLTFAVEVEPHWFLPVAPVEGRIASALVENMVAIREYVQNKRAVKHGTDPSNKIATAWTAMASIRSTIQCTRPWALSWKAKDMMVGRRQSFSNVGQFRRKVASITANRGGSTAFTQLRAASMGSGWLEAATTIEIARLLSRAELKMLGQETEKATQALNIAQADGVIPGAGAWGIAVAVAVAAALASSSSVPASTVDALPSSEDMSKPFQQGDNVVLDRIWQMVMEQHPTAVREQLFLGVPFGREDIEQRWGRFVQTLGIDESQALAILETDVTPLLVESDDVAEVLSRLAAISSKDKVLDLVVWNPALLVGGRAGLDTSRSNPGISAIVDVLYAGRLRNVLEQTNRDDAEKLTEIEMYSYAISSFKPLVDIIQRGMQANAASQRLFRTPLQIAAKLVPNSAVRVLLGKLASVPDPLQFLVGQTGAGFSISSNLVIKPSLAAAIFFHSPAILPHLPAIYTRLTILEPHVPAIVRILDPYLSIVEPHLDRIMERMDEIEPHLPYILLHLDVLAKHCGKLLDHFDALIPYASKVNDPVDLLVVGVCDEDPDGDLEECLLAAWDTPMLVEIVERRQREKSYLPQLMNYVDFLVPRLDALAPHLPLVRPHLPYLLPYLHSVLPYIDLFTDYPHASNNADVLVGYLGWMLKLPVLPRVLRIPLIPRFIARVSTMLPRWPIRWVLLRARRKSDLRNGITLTRKRGLKKTIKRRLK